MGLSGEQHLPVKDRHSSAVILHAGDEPHQPGDTANPGVFSGEQFGASLCSWGEQGFILTSGPG